MKGVTFMIKTNNNLVIQKERDAKKNTFYYLKQCLLNVISKIES